MNNNMPKTNWPNLISIKEENGNVVIEPIGDLKVAFDHANEAVKKTQSDAHWRDKVVFKLAYSFQPGKEPNKNALDWADMVMEEYENL